MSKYYNKILRIVRTIIKRSVIITMAIETKTIASIPIPPAPKVDEKTIWRYEDIISEKPRVSVREIDSLHKAIKVLRGMKKELDEKKSYSYKKKKLSLKSYFIK